MTISSRLRKIGESADELGRRALATLRSGWAKEYIEKCERRTIKSRGQDLQPSIGSSAANQTPDPHPADPGPGPTSSPPPSTPRSPCQHRPDRPQPARPRLDPRNLRPRRAPETKITSGHEDHQRRAERAPTHLVNDQGQRRDHENFRDAGTHRLGPHSVLLGRGRVTACVIPGVRPTSRDMGGMAWDVPRPERAFACGSDRTPSSAANVSVEMAGEGRPMSAKVNAATTSVSRWRGG